MSREVHSRLFVFYFLLFTPLGARVASAGGALELSGISWRRQSSLPSRKDLGSRDISVLELSPEAAIHGRLIARLAVVNQGPTVEGLLLRYSLSAEIAPQGGEPAAWTLPFAIDERRVPLVKAGQTSGIPIDPTALVQLYVKKVFREGYWPRRLKLQVMLEPRRAQAWPPLMLESVLPVAALPSHAGH